MRPSHIEDYLITVRLGQWFGWSDYKNKVYANLIVHDGGSKPTEQECTDGLAALQIAYDNAETWTCCTTSCMGFRKRQLQIKKTSSLP